MPTGRATVSILEIAGLGEYGKLGRTELRAEESPVPGLTRAAKTWLEPFRLWKAPKPGEPVWRRRFGLGRPGWHIEDTAITSSDFGPQYDVHGGAVDLIFPHHEAEIAQMEAASGQEPLVRCCIVFPYRRPDVQEPGPHAHYPGDA